MTVQCCACGKTRIDGAWSELQNATRGEVSHGYCPTCFAIARDQMRNGSIKDNEHAT